MEHFDEKPIGGSEMEIKFGSSLKEKIQQCLEEQVKTGADKIDIPDRPGLSIMTLALADEAEAGGAKKIYPLVSLDGKEMYLVQE